MLLLRCWLVILMVGLGPELSGLVTCGSVALGQEQEPEPEFEIAILDGRICDGTGAPWYQGDIGIRDGKIAHIGRISPDQANRVIKATGLIVAPGFIDMMGQTATPMYERPDSAINLLTQGITTINAGEGGSAAPLSPEAGAARGWQTMGEYFQMLELRGLPVNVVQTVGHTQIRQLVVGDANRRPTDEELDQMKALVREAMEAGAIGVSTALIYPPAVFATTQEIGELVEVAGQYGGRYYTHMRNEGDQLLEAIDEALEIGKRGNAPVHIFHLKAAGQQNWGKMPLAIARIQAARAAGQQVTADIYPYVNNGLGIDALIHPRHFGQGREKFLNRLKGDAQLRAEVRREMETGEGWENWFRHAGHDWNRIIVGQTNDPNYRPHVGKSVQSISASVQKDPWEVFFDLCVAGSFALPETMSRANKIRAMQQPFVSFCTDVGPAGGAGYASHPRAYGAFPRLLARYVRDLGALTIEQAICQASATAANSVMVYDRGRISVGLAADLIVFNEHDLMDRADFQNPDALSTGMEYVLVNGQVVLDQGKSTGKRPGRVLRGPGFDPAQSPDRILNGTRDQRFDGVEQILQTFLRQHRLPGVSVAIAKQGEVVYARGFGFADIGSREIMTPDHRFRIASISKPITAAAILKLVDQGKVDLDDPVFEILEYEKLSGADHVHDSRQDQITIRHLLQHRGGWDRDQSFDAMFRSVEFAQLAGVAPPADPDAIIRVMLGKPLDFEPGQRYAYSNYGYCLLGRVIEKISGQDYESFVQQQVLAPLGISEMQIGRTGREHRADMEVCYYHPSRGSSVFAEDVGVLVPHPYGAWNLEAMDSHGAWIATATDLVRFSSALADRDHCPILTPERLDEMWERPEGLAGYDQQGEPLSGYYGLGWSIQGDAQHGPRRSHSGSLPGTNTILVQRGDGITLAILFSTRVSYRTNRVINEILPILEAELDKVYQHADGQ